MTLLIVVICLAAGFFTAKLHSRYVYRNTIMDGYCGNIVCSHLYRRDAAITSQAKLSARPNYLALGDSFIELAPLPELCGRMPVNAGIGGATADTIAPLVSKYVKAARPDFVVISIGANDAVLKSKTFASDLATIMKSIGHVPVFFIELPDIPKLANRDAYNVELRRHGPTIISPVKPTTVDGLHFDTATYRRWLSDLQATCGSMPPATAKPAV